MTDVNFEGLFTIELLHKFYADTLCPDFTITPSSNTVKVINGRKLIVKQHHNKLYAGMQSSAGIPAIAVEDGMQMTFNLWLNNPVFANYTNLPAGYNSGAIFYFTNRNNNTANGKTLLSAPVAAYSNAVSYVPGNLAADVSHNIYRAIKTNNPGNKHALTDANYWILVDKNGYASDPDVLQYFTPISAYNFTGLQSAAVISVSGYNSVTGDYTLPVLSTTITFLNPVPLFNLDLSGLSNGKYSLTINGVQQWIYLDAEPSAGKPFGIIDIFNAVAPASCQLVDGAGKLQSPSPSYTIYFLNRATIWKYVPVSGGTVSISDPASAYSFASLPGGITSTTPIPLSDTLLNLKLTVNGSDFSPIPCADPQRLTSLTQAGDTYACSEIHINY